MPDDIKYEKMPALFNYDESNEKRDISIRSPRYSTTDKGLIALYEVLHGMDWGQTSQIARNPDKYHENKMEGGGYAELTGPHPSRDTVHALGAAQAIAPIIMYNTEMPDAAKKFIMGLLIAIKANNVKGNESVGLKAMSW